MNKKYLEKIRNFTITKESLVKIFNLLLKSKRLVFIVFWGAVLIFSFDIIYKKAYVDIESINYDYKKVYSSDAEISALSRISDEIILRKNNARRGVTVEYRDPFQFYPLENVEVLDGGEQTIEQDGIGDIISGGF